MKEIDVEKIINSLIDRIYPKEMKAPELRELAKGASFSAESIRQIRRRKSLEAKTLIRLLLAIGVHPNDLINLPQKGNTKISRVHSEWNRLGTTLTESEVKEFVAFIKHVRKQWRLNK